VERTNKIDGYTRFAAIFGDPVEHSLSPAMHNAAYAKLGLNRAYVAFHVTRDHLGEALQAVRTLGLVGVNLTVPHKEAAVPLTDSLSDEAKMLGAVNCVINRDGTLVGDNTDARGLERDLRDARIDLRGKRAIVIGAGGAAASAIVAAARLGANRVTICNRTLARAATLAERLRNVSGVVPIEARGLDGLAEASLLESSAIVMNATPIGLGPGELPPIAYETTAVDCLFYDLVYAREATPFIKRALASGRRTMDGAGMLIGQGELAFELFNGVAPPEGIMRGALMKALGR